MKRQKFDPWDDDSPDPDPEPVAPTETAGVSGRTYRTRHFGLDYVSVTDPAIRKWLQEMGFAEIMLKGGSRWLIRRCD
ncbi:MAG: hypothetical protein AB1330_10765 [Bacillota bacterium]